MTMPNVLTLEILLGVKLNMICKEKGLVDMPFPLSIFVTRMTSTTIGVFKLECTGQLQKSVVVQ